jgi:UDP-3-O-[3-hydroxymyristoyl] glucosamine N-acyltransferase
MPELTAAQLAKHLNLPLRGDAGRKLTGAATLEEATPNQLSFAANLKYSDAATRSKAGVIIAPPGYQPSEQQTIIESPQPRAHFAQALALLYPSRKIKSGIHPTATIDKTAQIDPTAEIQPNVTIGANTKIGPRAIIGANSNIGADVEIGANTILHPGVTIYDRVRVGSRCLLHAGAVIGADGFGFELSAGAWQKVPQVGAVLIADEVEIGANTCIDRATLGTTTIGEGTKLDNQVHIAHNCQIGRHVVIAAQTGLAGGVSIGDYAVIGGQVGAGDKARIESKAIVGSGAGILTSKIVRAGEPVWGTPARPLRQYLEQLATLSRLARKRQNK